MDANVNVLCGADETVEFPEVAKPLEDKGFFTVGVLEVPSVVPGEDTYHSITGLVIAPQHPWR